MASRKAKKWLESIGQPIRKPHTTLELANFSAGTGSGKFPMPYHVIRMDSRTGDSKRTVGWEATLVDAKRTLKALKDADAKDNRGNSGAEIVRNRYFTYYVRDIRNGNTYTR